MFRLFGYAGTGKTTLAQHFAQDVAGPVLFGAFTGKAALVLRQRGCFNATTIHKLIYQPKDKSKIHLLALEDAYNKLRATPNPGADILNEMVELEQQILEEKENLKRPSFTLDMNSAVRDAALVVIDECSMVDGAMGSDLLSFGTKVLVLGDPAQLPPINGAGFFTECNPDIMLTEIHRQAKDNPIVAMATEVRMGRCLPMGQYGESCVMTREDSRYGQELFMAGDQVIVGKNDTRRRFNARFREVKGFSGDLPVKGDKLVCLRNNHDLGLLNGAIWTVDEVFGSDDDSVGMKVRDGEDTVEVMAHAAIFKGEDVPYWAKRDAEEFDFGYALTCHKAQGSQWGHVIVIDESAVFRQDRARWLYTAITRASEKVTVIK